MSLSSDVLQKAGTGSADVLSFLNALEVEEVMQITLPDYVPTPGGVYFSSKSQEYKDPRKSEPPQVLAFIYTQLSDSDEFIQPLPSFGFTSYDPGYAGYPGVGYTEINVQRTGVVISSVSDGFFGGFPLDFIVFVLRDKTDKKNTASASTT